MCFEVVEKDDNEILVCTPFLLIRAKAPFKDSICNGTK